jgi:DNA-directed RNA polymerase specialized sigma24 family protein
MDFVDLVRAASKGDVNAFVTLTRRSHPLAFGSALSLVRDCRVAEDVPRDVFLAAWSALPRPSDPAAFPLGSAASSGTMHCGCCVADS